MGKNRGQFVKYVRDKALKVDFDGTKYYEIALKYADLKLFGDYSSLYFYKMSEMQLYEYFAKELKIIRNEIFARLRYKFKPGGVMDKYFRSKDLYVPAYTNVDNMLNEIEKYNIDLIKKV